MDTDPTRTVFRLMGDARLAAGVLGAAAYVAESMGFPPDECAALASVVGEASRDTFRLLANPSAMVGVTLEQFPDRMEVLLEYEGGSLSTADLRTYAATGLAESESQGRSRVSLRRSADRIHFDVQGRMSRLRMIKYLPTDSMEK